VHQAYRSALSLLIPPRCAACASRCAAAATLCGGCERALAAGPPGSAALAGVGQVFWAAPYVGAARELVAALKFAGRLALAERAAAAIVDALPAELSARAVVPVPASPWRRRRRGFDPAEEIARAVAQRIGVPFAPLLRRRGGPRQVGRRRRERVSSPPRVWATQPHPHPALLIDDVLTTGATLRACAAALRDAGCGQLQAAVFARALGAGAISA
jgi:predicted amidophosphoribosyltransferase